MLFIAFVPLLVLEGQFSETKTKGSHISIFKYVFITFFAFVVTATYWLSIYSFSGALSIWIFHAFLMSLVFILFHITKKHFGETTGYLSFVAYWMAFEYLNLNWDLGWPWLNFGNGLAGYPVLIQWYELTGIGGGTLWILLTNLVVFYLFKNWMAGGKLSLKPLLLSGSLAVIPIFLSYILFMHHKLPTKTLKDSVAIIQPDIDAYRYKLQDFNEANLKQQIDLIKPLLEKIKGKTFDYVVLPETVLPKAGLLNTVWDNPAAFIQDYVKPGGWLIFGMYLKDEINRKFNTVAYFKNNTLQAYHIKKRLVPGVEFLPILHNFGLFDKEDVPFHEKYYSKPTQQLTEDDKPGFPTAICYESVFGADLAKQAAKQTKPILIVSNDGWFDNTGLIEQHLNIAKIRAIENRRFVVRAANTGISAVINHYGVVEQSLANQQAGILEFNVPRNSQRKTFYQKSVDLLYRIFALVALILMLYTIVAQFTNNFKFKRMGIK